MTKMMNRFSMRSFRFWNMNGRKNGQISLVISSKRVKPANRCVKIIWKFWNFSGSIRFHRDFLHQISFWFFSEEVFDFSSGQMTQAKAKHLKDTMCNEFTKIFQLCEYVVVRNCLFGCFYSFSIVFHFSKDKSRHPPLLLVTLETLLRFLSWIPLGYIFETNMVNTLIETFFTVPMFRNVTLRCLTEIGTY